MDNNETIVAIGIGGTGSKIVEALIHLAASGNAPLNIYPILIDQDSHNGNVERCKRVIDNYKQVKLKIRSTPNQWLLKPTLSGIESQLLPLVPEDSKINFAATLKISSMRPLEQKLISSLYTESQLSEILKYGFKKRAHMGAPIVEKLLLKESLKPDTEPGLQKIISQVINHPSIKVFVCGSLFGGTGASGITLVGKYFKEHLSNAQINSIMLTPYFVISEQYEDNEHDAGLVRSDADMQLVKVALEIYQNDIEEAFKHVLIIGSQKDRINDEVVTKTAHSGGENQVNPAHIFEVLAASFMSKELNDVTKTTYHTYIASANEGIPPFAFNKLPSNIEMKSLLLFRSFASLISNTCKAPNSWKKRQPWLPTIDEEYKILVDWAIRHDLFWKELSNFEIKEHSWKKFYYDDKIIHQTFSLASTLSKYLKMEQANTIADTLQTINELC